MLISLAIMLILSMPMSALAESFTVTTNKDIYAPDEKMIIVGAIPEDAPEGYAVLIKVTGPDGDCAAQNILPAADNSFRSRPTQLDECGFGEFTVSAFYAEWQAYSRFTISNSSQIDAGSKLELRVLKNVMLQALEVVNTRVKELIEGGYVLPEEVADKHSEGVSEASLALQAIEFGDAAEAKKHMILALQDFREVLKALSEDIARFEQSEEQQAAGDSNSIVGRYNWLQRYYFRLVELAEKNKADMDSQFDAAALLLKNTKQMIDERNLEDAGRNLEQVKAILEEIRADLINNGKEAGNSNGTSQYDELSKKLADLAAKYERKALQLLNKTGSDAEQQAKLEEALSLIANAATSIKAQEFDSAKHDLRAAYQIIEQVAGMIEDRDEDDKNSTSNSGKSSGNGNSGESSSDDDEGSDSNSGKGKDDDKDKDSDDTEGDQ